MNGLPKEVGLRLGLFSSHGGSNLQAIVDACTSGALQAKPAVVVGNNSTSLALQRAHGLGIPVAHLSSRTHPSPEALDNATLEVLAEHGVNLVVLAGYMKRLGPKTVQTYRGRIINIHPALLPRHGGQGMYGERVHQAVIDAGDVATGATVHVCDEEYDNGPILAQATVEVLPTDDAASLGARVLVCEHQLYVQTLQRIATGEIVLPRL